MAVLAFKCSRCGILGNVKIAVFGLGYVGCVTAACLADLGHRVQGVDVDDLKLSQIRKGKAPFYEPGLDQILARVTESGLLTSTSSATEALQGADIAMICVGTPSGADGNIDLTHLHRVCSQLGGLIPAQNKDLTIAVRSTVFPGVCDEIQRTYFASFPGVNVVANPEFLREGVAVGDFYAPSLIVVGGSNSAAVAQMAKVYEKLNQPVHQVDIHTAEMVKYACNAFHAVKIAFANEIGSLCEGLNIDGSSVMRVLCQDTKLNASAAYLRPGFAFGGSCLPKDLRALDYRARRCGVEAPLLENVLASNLSHLTRDIEKVCKLKGRLGILGLTFKEGTDDLRESPVLTLLEALLDRGRELRVFDPKIRLESIYGANQRYLLSSLPAIADLMVGSVQEIFDWADAVVLTQRVSSDIEQILNESSITVMDLSRTLKLEVGA